jgi:nucleoside-diphosphate-sugar epimerase
MRFRGNTVAVADDQVTGCSGMGRRTRAVGAFPNGKRRHECVMWTGAKWGTRNGGLSRDFTYIENVVNRILRAAEVPDDSEIVFNGGAGARITLNEVVQQLKEITGKKIACNTSRLAMGISEIPKQTLVSQDIR